MNLVLFIFYALRGCLEAAAAAATKKKLEALDAMSFNV